MRHLPHPLALAALCLFGCSGPRGSNTYEAALAADDAQRLAESRFREEPFTDQVRHGVLRQRALFDHHFVPESARLTRLGERDLGILAEELREQGGTIALPRGSESEELHAERVAAVSAALVARGIAPDQIAVETRPAAGPGVASTDALAIRSRLATSRLQAPSSTPASSATSINSTGNLQ
ncbi:MAG: hypothetical protein FJ298_00065 [Planctomycetes bacterium]|nr:hypothetical protein [Planctomycetota bacterium]